MVFPLATSDLQASCCTELSYAGALDTAIHSLGQKAGVGSDDDSDLDLDDEVQDIFVDDLEGFNPEDEQTFNAFMQNDSTQEGSLLADIIMAKLQKKAPAQTAGADEPGEEESGLTDEVATVYQDVGKLLSRCPPPAPRACYKHCPCISLAHQLLKDSCPPVSGTRRASCPRHSRSSRTCATGRRCSS